MVAEWCRIVDSMADFDNKRWRSLVDMVVAASNMRWREHPVDRAVVVGCNTDMDWIGNCKQDLVVGYYTEVVVDWIFGTKDWSVIAEG